MNCWHCERPAHATCMFCGRAVCKDHVRDMPHIIALLRNTRGVAQALVTSRAVFCGVCEPREELIDVPELR